MKVFFIVVAILKSPMENLTSTWHLILESELHFSDTCKLLWRRGCITGATPFLHSTPSQPQEQDALARSRNSALLLSNALVVRRARFYY
jgi:hypothetical protein